MTFEAKFVGICKACEERIHLGDACVYNDAGEVVHENCEDHAPVERPTVTCTECWMIKPCECDD